MWQWGSWKRLTSLHWLNCDLSQEKVPNEKKRYQTLRKTEKNEKRRRLQKDLGASENTCNFFRGSQKHVLISNIFKRKKNALKWKKTIKHFLMAKIFQRKKTLSNVFQRKKTFSNVWQQKKNVQSEVMML